MRTIYAIFGKKKKKKPNHPKKSYKEVSLSNSKVILLNQSSL